MMRIVQNKCVNTLFRAKYLLKRPRMRLSQKLYATLDGAKEVFLTEQGDCLHEQVPEVLDDGQLGMCSQAHSQCQTNTNDT